MTVKRFPIVPSLTRVGLLGLLIAAAGCTTMSKDECLQADWFAVGEKDASQGYPQSRLESHRESCAEFGVRPAPLEYRAGYRRGIPYYCNEQKGWDEGRQGSQYYNVCPPELERDFLRGYRLGRDLHDLEQELANIDRRMDAIEDELANPDLPRERRRSLRRELDDLRSDARDVERRLGRLEAQARHRGYGRW